MSNIVPQQRKGHVVWGKLENQHRHVVADASKGIKAVWLISGPVFLNGQAEKVIGPDRVGASHVVYKIIGWQKAGGGFTARGDVVKHEGSGSDLTAFLDDRHDYEGNGTANLPTEGTEEGLCPRQGETCNWSRSGCRGRSIIITWQHRLS